VKGYELSESVKNHNQKFNGKTEENHTKKKNPPSWQNLSKELP
jgi:hypothetical protein